MTEQNQGPVPEMDKRRYRRKTVMWSGKLSLLWGARLLGDEQTVPGIVRDMSVTGAKFQTKDFFSGSAHAILEIPRFGTFKCNLVWQKGHVVGLNFMDPPDEIFETVNSALPGIGLDPNPIS
ncbi:MAG: hypothetical protein EP348_11910 [Alphaproteobacteria bacterium]|nr:MAG: hypothetical protein EP348_11910 [Alphaproteobacteria bacterium]